MPSPLTHSMQAGGRAACSLPGPPACSLPAQRRRPEPFWGQEPGSGAGRRQPCPQLLHLPPSSADAHPILRPITILVFVPRPLSYPHPVLHTPTPFCTTSGPPLSLPLCTPTFKHALPWPLFLHLQHFCALVPFATLHPRLTISAHTEPR